MHLEEFILLVILNMVFNPVRRILPSECPNCNQNTLSLYDNRNRRINYSLLCKYNTFDQIKKQLNKFNTVIDALEKSNLKYLQCDNCKSIFVLDWTKKEIPYPCTKDKYKKFER